VPEALRKLKQVFMPLSQHRPALAAILVAVVAVLSVTVAASPVAAAPSTNAIAETAVSYDGTGQGECWIFIRKVVLEATGRTIGFDYRDGFFEAGAVEVSAKEAQPGDIIQIARDSDTSPGADYPGLHTSIVLANLGGEVFDVVDSNQNFDGVVHLRPGYDIAAATARYPGLSYHIYRIGEGSAALPPTPSPVPIPGERFVVGEHARVFTPGECLNLRSGPGRDFEPLGCLAHRTTVTIIGEPRTTDLSWVKVSTPAGDGWVAANFLAKEPAAARPSSAGAVGPVLQRRAFIAIAAAD
jgi:uncharacterized protein YgiM (DUF1202 family)